MNNLALVSQTQPQNPQGTDDSSVFLRFQIDAEISAVFPMEQVQEVVVISPRQLTPIFNMPACLLGLLTRRSRIMWVADLAHLLLGKSYMRDGASAFQRYKVVVIKVDPQWVNQEQSMNRDHRQVLLGLVVHDVKGSVQLSKQAIQPPQGYFSPEIAPFVRGSILQDNSMLLVLDAEAIVRSSRLQSGLMPS